MTTRHPFTGPPHSERLYRVWSGILQRTGNKKSRSYVNYGGRGITLADEFRDYMKFREYILTYLGVRPSKRYTLDRIDNNKGYEPGNLRWATSQEQARNTRRTMWVVFDGKESKLLDVIDKHGKVPREAVYRRLKQGWPLDLAIKTPDGFKLNGGPPTPHKATHLLSRLRLRV